MLGIILERVYMNIFTMDKLLPNAFLGMFVSFVSILFLYRMEGMEDKIVSFNKRDIFPISILLCLGVIVVSPLPFRGNGGLLKLISVMCLLVIYTVTSYTDIKKKEFYLGFLLVGLLVQMILLAISLLCKNVYFTTLDVKILLGCALFNLFMGFIPGGYSLGDMGLIFMSLMGFMVLTDGAFMAPFVVMYVIAFFSYAICSTVILLPKALLVKEKLNFPFTLYLMIGTVIGIFFL